MEKGSPRERPPRSLCCSDEMTPESFHRSNWVSMVMESFLSGCAVIVRIRRFDLGGIVPVHEFYQSYTAMGSTKAARNGRGGRTASIQQMSHEVGSPLSKYPRVSVRITRKSRRSIGMPWK